MAFKDAFANFGYEVVDGEDRYGKYIHNASTKNKDFVSYGRYIGIEMISRDMDGGETVVTIGYDAVDGTSDSIDIDRGLLSKKGELQSILLQKGADVHAGSISVLLNCLRQSESTATLGSCFRRTGWRLEGGKLEFRGNKLISSDPTRSSRYVGRYDLACKGSFKGWKSLVQEHVLGHPPLEIAVLIGLSPIVSSLVGSRNLIFHLMGDSGKGKTTCGVLACSVASCPNPAETTRRVTPEGKPLRTLMSSWRGTANALTAKLDGLDGTLMVYDELSKVEDPKILTTTIYTLSDGEDKDRMLSATELQTTSVVRTNILSLGEESLLEKAANQNSGINVRVCEISADFTDSAEHSECIVSGCFDHYGHAAMRFARHIIQRMTVDEVSALRIKHLDDMEEALVNANCTSQTIRRLAEFGAILLTAAEIAEEALGIFFDRNEVKKFLVQQHCACGQNQDIGLRAHEALRGYISTHVANFSVGSPTRWAKSIPCFGRIETRADGITKEVSIPTSDLPKILSGLGFNNTALVVKRLKEHGLLNCEAGKTYRKRIISTDAGKVRVYAIIFP